MAQPVQPQRVLQVVPGHTAKRRMLGDQPGDDDPERLSAGHDRYARPAERQVAGVGD